MAKNKNPAAEPIFEELVAIKKLLALAMLRNGSNQDDIALALGVSQGTVSKMFPGGVGRKAKSKASCAPEPVR